MDGNLQSSFLIENRSGYSIVPYEVNKLIQGIVHLLDKTKEHSKNTTTFSSKSSAMIVPVDYGGKIQLSGNTRSITIHNYFSGCELNSLWLIYLL